MTPGASAKKTALPAAATALPIRSAGARAR